MYAVQFSDFDYSFETFWALSTAIQSVIYIFTQFW